MQQHLYITLEVEDNKVVKVEQPANILMNLPVNFYLLTKDLKNKTINTALNELAANGWKLIDVSKGKVSSNIKIGVFPPLISEPTSTKTFYQLQYPSD